MVSDSAGSGDVDLAGNDMVVDAQTSLVQIVDVTDVVEIPVDDEAPLTQSSQEAGVTNVPAIASNPWVRISSRIQALGGGGGLISDAASDAARKKNLEGITSIASKNSFAILDDEDITHRALEMGIDICTMSLQIVHMLKDLERARKDMAAQKNKLASNLIDNEDIKSSSDKNNFENQIEALAE